MRYIYGKGSKTPMYIEQIINEYGPSVYSFALSRLKNEDDAADVYQTVFLKLFSKKPKFSKPHQIKSWLMKTTYNCTTDIFRRRKNTVELTDDIPHQDERGFYDLLDTLPELYRDAVYLYYGESMRVSEIAKVLGISAGGVKSRLARARKYLKEEL